MISRVKWSQVFPLKVLTSLQGMQRCRQVCHGVTCVKGWGPVILELVSDVTAGMEHNPLAVVFILIILGCSLKSLVPEKKLETMATQWSEGTWTVSWFQWHSSFLSPIREVEQLFSTDRGSFQEHCQKFNWSKLITLGWWWIPAQNGRSWRSLGASSVLFTLQVCLHHPKQGGRCHWKIFRGVSFTDVLFNMRLIIIPLNHPTDFLRATEYRNSVQLAQGITTACEQQSSWGLGVSRKPAGLSLTPGNPMVVEQHMVFRDQGRVWAALHSLHD